MRFLVKDLPNDQSRVVLSDNIHLNIDHRYGF